MANGNCIIIKSILTGKLNNNNNYEKESHFKKNKKELKEQSTNTYINDNDINNCQSETLRITSLDSNKNNEQEIKIIQPKSSLNKKTNLKNLVENMKIFNQNKQNKIITKKNHVKQISINNNINFNNDCDKNNNYKFFLELYNFLLIQSMIQNRSNYFNYKNNHLLDIQTPKSPNPSNLTFFANNTSPNKISLRELYRNLNKENESFNFLKKNQKRKNRSKKKRTKTYDDKKSNRHKNIFERNTKHNLMNVQYNLDKINQNKYKDINNVFQKIFFTKRNSYINNKTRSKSKDYIKTTFNFYNNNMFSKQNKNRIYDELDKGLSNSSSQVKSFVKNPLKKIKKM